jgi:hypothetical protein
MAALSEHFNIQNAYMYVLIKTKVEICTGTCRVRDRVKKLERDIDFVLGIHVWMA